MRHVVERGKGSLAAFLRNLPAGDRSKDDTHLKCVGPDWSACRDSA